MRGIKLGMLVSCIVLSLSSCVKDTLVFPEQEVDNTPKEPIDVIAKPSDVKIEGAYDYHFVIKWPMMSDRVAKVVVDYMDNGEAKTKEFSDFSEDGVIETSQFGEYTFTMKTISKSELISKPVAITAVNKGFIIEEVLDNAVISLLDGEVEVKLVNPNQVPIKTTIIYPGTSESMSMVHESSEELIVMTFPAQDGTHAYTVELEDEQNRTASQQYSYTFQYIVNSSLVAGYGVGRYSVNNNANSGITLKVTYPVAGGGTTTVERSYTSAEAVFDFVPVDGTHEVVVEYEDAGGRQRSETFTYTHYPFVFKSFTTAAEKADWSVTVSSNATNDGTGPNALLDGQSNTYWHTPWSGDIPPWPHHATVTFDREIQLTKFTIFIRHNNGNGSPKEFDLQVSTDGTNFTTHQAYTNSVNTAGASISFDITNPVATKYVRLLFRNNIAGSESMALAEINFEGNQNL